ncbi:MAG TPA: hypothetical protein VHQ41_03110 [Patescibacteria group bacterium]|jgi:hypothetical protein|nr:hypothetical protein [Patescibacteria group bacterium]
MKLKTRAILQTIAMVFLFGAFFTGMLLLDSKYVSRTPVLFLLIGSVGSIIFGYLWNPYKTDYQDLVAKIKEIRKSNDFNKNGGYALEELMVEINQTNR